MNNLSPHAFRSADEPSRRGFLITMMGAGIMLGYARKGLADQSSGSTGDLFEPTIWYGIDRSGVRGGGRGYQNGGPHFASLSPRLSLFSDHLRTVLAVKGSLRRAQQRRALDGSGPFRTTLLRRGKGLL